MATQRSEVDLDFEARLDGRVGDGLLERVAVALGSTLDLREVLRRLAEMVQEVTSAQRCSIVLIEGNGLRPAVALGSRPDDDLWSAFRSMDPIELTEDHWVLLRAGRAIAFDDARDAEVIPRRWIESFSLRALVAVPLVVHGEPIGVMAVDWPEVRHVDRAELALLEAIGTYAALAVRNARLHEDVAARSVTTARLVEVASALNSSSSLSHVLELICSSFEQLLGTAHCSVNLTDPFDPLRLHTLAASGEPWFERGPDGAPAVVPEELGPADEAWGARSGPLVYPSVGAAGDGVCAPSTVRSAALFPLFGPEGLMGLVVTGFPDPGGPGEHEAETGQTLAELAATAITRADLYEHLRRRVRQLELLSRLSEVVTGETSIDEVLDQMADGLAADLGMRLETMVVVDPEVREAIGGTPPDATEEEAVAAWREGLVPGAASPRLRPAEGAVLVPVVHRQRVLGALRVRVGDDPLGLTDEQFLLAVGGGCAEVVHRALVGRTVAANQRRVAVATERERIAQELRDSAGALVSGMGMRLAGYLDDAPDERWRHRLTTLMRQAQQADRELREAVSSLLFLEVQADGLVRSLRELAGRFSATTGIGVDVVLEGAPGPLVPEHDDALFRVALEALSNVERHADAASASLTLVYDESQTCLRVDDDGVGAPEGEWAASPARFGLRGAGGRVEELGGSLTLRRLSPHGTRVEALLPHGRPAAGGEPGEG